MLSVGGFNDVATCETVDSMLSSTLRNASCRSRCENLQSTPKIPHGLAAIVAVSAQSGVRTLPKSCKQPGQLLAYVLEPETF